MRSTFASVQKQAVKLGWTPVQLDGIPDGFSYKTPDLTIGDVMHQGRYAAFVPLNNDEVRVYGDTAEELLKNYNQYGF